MQHCNYDSLLTYCATSGLRKTFYCKRNLVNVLVKIEQKS